MERRSDGFSLTDPADERGRRIRAGIYTRLSMDPHGTRLAVQRQEQEARELCERQGWTVAEVYEDDDISAFSGKPRKRYLQLLADVQAGNIDAIVSWHPDRLHRSPRELEDFIDVVEGSGASVLTVRSGEYDLSTASGRMTARVVGAVARHESEHKSERLKSWWRQRYELGRVNGSRRPFGYVDAKRTAVVEEEAELIKEAAQRVLTGDTLLGIARDWRRRGLVGTTGRPWTAGTLRVMIVAASISGRYEEQRDQKGQKIRIGRILGDAKWETIITPEQSDQIRSKLGDPRRRTASGRPAGLLLTGKSGVGRCGLCGAPLLSRIHKVKLADGSTARTRVLICPKEKIGGCGRLQIVNAPVERIVSDAVLDAIDDGALTALMRSHVDQEALSELARVESRRAELAAMWAAEELTRKEWVEAKAVLDKREQELTRRVEAGRRRVGLDGLPEHLRAAWDPVEPDGRPVLSLTKKRAIISALIESVAIGPSPTRGKFEPERIAIKWRA